MMQSVYNVVQDWSRTWEQETDGKENHLRSPYLDREFEEAREKGHIPQETETFELLSSSRVESIWLLIGYLLLLQPNSLFDPTLDLPITHKFPLQETQNLGGSWSALSQAGEATNLNLVHLTNIDCTDVEDLTKVSLREHTTMGIDGVNSRPPKTLPQRPFDMIS